MVSAGLEWAKVLVGMVIFIASILFYCVWNLPELLILWAECLQEVATIIEPLWNETRPALNKGSRKMLSLATNRLGTCITAYLPKIYPTRVAYIEDSPPALTYESVNTEDFAFSVWLCFIAVICVFALMCDCIRPGVGGGDNKNN